MILKTFDGKELYITSQQAEAINAAIAGGVKMIEINTGERKVYVAAGAVATIMSGGQPPKSDSTPRIEAHHNETEEEKEARLARNRAKLAEMKADLIKKGVLKA